MKRSKERTFDSLCAKVMFPSLEIGDGAKPTNESLLCGGVKSRRHPLGMYILHSKKKYQRPTFRI